LNRRGFLALPAVAFFARLASKVRKAPRRLLSMTIVGLGSGATHTTIAAAVGDTKPGGIVFLEAGYSETFTCPLDIGDHYLVGMDKS